MERHVFSMQDLSYLVLATVIIFAVEFLTRRLKGASLRDYGVTAICILTNSAIMRPLAGALVGSIIIFLVPQHAGALSELPLWITFPVIFALCEFCFYWVHRWSHEAAAKPHSKWFWKLHRTHHSADHLDVSITMRQNAFWAFVVPHTWIVAIALYLGQGEAAALAVIAIYAWNLFTHTNYCWDESLGKVSFLRPALRVFQHIIITPMMHHAHHGFGGPDGKMYRNYAVTLAVYDWMFGTLHIPKGRPARYGVPEKKPHWAEEVFFPVVRISPNKVTKTLVPEPSTD